MGQYFCVTNWQKESFKTKTSVHVKRLFQHFLKRFHHFVRSLKELVLKQRLDILAFTTLSEVVCVLNCPYTGGWAVALCWWSCSEASLQWDKVEGLNIISTGNA